jgi:hypothetical protein
LPLFTEVRGIGILGSPFAGSWIRSRDPRLFVIDRNIRHFLWYGVVAGDGLRSVGEEALPSSKSVCSILPIAICGPGLSVAPAFSCTATSEERYFCCPLDRCGLAPASRTVSPRSGKDLCPLTGPSRVLSLAGPLHHQSHRASGLRFAPSPCRRGLYYVH